MHSVYARLITFIFSPYSCNLPVMGFRQCEVPEPSKAKEVKVMAYVQGLIRFLRPLAPESAVENSKFRIVKLSNDASRETMAPPLATPTIGDIA